MLSNEERSNINDVVYEVLGVHPDDPHRTSEEYGSGQLTVCLSSNVKAWKMDELCARLGFESWEAHIRLTKHSGYLTVWFISNETLLGQIEKQRERAEKDPDNLTHYLWDAYKCHKKRVAIADNPLDKAFRLVQASRCAVQAQKYEKAVDDANRAVEISSDWNNSKTHGLALQALEDAKMQAEKDSTRYF